MFEMTTLPHRFQGSLCLMVLFIIAALVYSVVTAETHCNQSTLSLGGNHLPEAAYPGLPLPSHNVKHRPCMARSHARVIYGPMLFDP